MVGVGAEGTVTPSHSYPLPSLTPVSLRPFLIRGRRRRVPGEGYSKYAGSSSEVSGWGSAVVGEGGLVAAGDTPRFLEVTLRVGLLLRPRALLRKCCLIFLTREDTQLSL